MVKGKAPKRRTPQRTCVSCRQVQGKRELVRVVRTPGGHVQVDATGKLAGRGAYLCPVAECWREALVHRRLDGALKTRLSDDERAELTEFMQGLPQSDGLTNPGTS
jgi:predicted RNA-binding protein YlxR (DUF448 family)